MKKVFYTIALFSAILVATSVPARAQYNGNPPPQKIYLDKQIGLPSKTNGNTTYQYIDNVNVDSYHYSVSEDILFRLIVKNVSTVTLENVYIEDRFPAVLAPYSDGFELDTNTNILTIRVGTLYPSESKTYTVRAAVRSYEWLPEDRVSCHQNYAFANNGNTIDDDTSGFCIEKPLLSPTPTVSPTPVIIYEPTPTPKIIYKPIPLKHPPKKIPSTGPEYLLPIMALSPLGILIGRKLRQMS